MVDQNAEVQSPGLNAVREFEQLEMKCDKLGTQKTYHNQTRSSQYNMDGKMTESSVELMTW